MVAASYLIMVFCLRPGILEMENELELLPSINLERYCIKEIGTQLFRMKKKESWKIQKMG